VGRCICQYGRHSSRRYAFGNGSDEISARWFRGTLVAHNGINYWGLKNKKRKLLKNNYRQSHKNGALLYNFTFSMDLIPSKEWH
jgi:hypothetical protein